LEGAWGTEAIRDCRQARKDGDTAAPTCVIEMPGPLADAGGGAAPAPQPSVAEVDDFLEHARRIFPAVAS
jgi:hypothetical protein